MNTKFAISSLAIVLSLTLLGAGCGEKNPVVEEGEKDAATVEVEAGWQVYTDARQRFSFQHPSGTHVTANGTGNELTILSAPPSDSPVPDMTISIAEGNVHFAAWEDFEIPYFNRLVSSFEFK